MKPLHTTTIGLALLLSFGSVSASEVIGTLSTGIGNSSVSGVVVAAPSASVAAGTYTATQSVTLTSLGSLSIRYTVDGTVPTCSTGTLYSGAIAVVSSLTIKAIACYVNNGASPVASYAYTISAAVVTSSGGGGGGGGGGSSYVYVPPTAATTTATTTKVTAAATTSIAGVVTGGQVLGASSVTFLVDLKMGVRGRDVLELQKFLIAQGLLKVAAPTNYFGLMTRNALIAFQKKNKIVPAVGYFGPTTRALVNKINKGL